MNIEFWMMWLLVGFSSRLVLIASCQEFFKTIFLSVMNYLSVTSFLIPLMLVANQAGAVVLTNSNVQLSPSMILGEDFGITIFQDSGGEDPTSFLFGFDGSVLTGIGMNADEGSDWYLTDSGDSFTRNAILSEAFPVLATSDEMGFTFNSVTAGTDNFFLGFTTSGFSSTGFPDRDVFGWVEIESSGTDLMIVQSAISYSEGDDTQRGIIVGTSQAIPEPSTILLLSLLSPCFLLRRR